MLVDQLRPKWRIQRIRVGPAKHLMLEQGIVDAFKKIAEAGQQVALAHQEVNRKSDVQGSLNQIQLLGEATGLLSDLFGGILDQALHRENDKQPINRAVRASLSQQPHELRPLSGL